MVNVIETLSIVNGNIPFYVEESKFGKSMIRYALEDEPVLLTGEAGTGKSYMSKHIHQLSGRKGSYEVLNCSNMPFEIFESELFGHKKSSFTGAVSDKARIVEEAENGTLFLDEIAECPNQVQAKLLYFLEEKKFRRIGERKESSVDVRLVFATNKDLKDEVKRGRFREDIYYRISTFMVHIPPLRDDIELMEKLIDEFRYLLRAKKLSKETKEVLLKYSWPGSTRELKQVMTRAGINVEKDVIGEREIIQCMKNHLNEKELETFGIATRKQTRS